MEERTKGLVHPPNPQEPGAISFAIQDPPEPEDDDEDNLSRWRRRRGGVRMCWLCEKG